MTKKTDRFTYRCPLRWSDLDAQGHVNNAMLMTYLQEARVAFLNSGPARDMLDAGVVVVRHQVQYRRAMHYDDKGLCIDLGISHLGAARYEVCYDVTQDDELVAEARTTLCPIDFSTGRPQRLTTTARAFFEAYQTSVEPFSSLNAPALTRRGTSVDIHVRWNDLDRYGHVNNAVLFDYVQQARIESTTTWDPDMARTGAQGSKYSWLVARQDVDYVRQITPGEVTVRTAPIRLGSSSLTLAAEVEQGGQVAARARTVLVCGNADGEPIALPDSTKQRLREHVIED